MVFLLVQVTRIKVVRHEGVFFIRRWGATRPGSEDGALGRRIVPGAVIKFYIVYAVRAFIDCKVSTKMSGMWCLHVVNSR